MARTIGELAYQISCNANNFKAGATLARQEKALLKSLLGDVSAEQKYAGQLDVLSDMLLAGKLVGDQYTQALKSINAEFDETSGNNARAALEATNAAMAEATAATEQLAALDAVLAQALQTAARKQAELNAALDSKELAEATAETERLRKAEAAENQEKARAKQIIDSLKSPMDKHQEELRELEALLKRGRLTQQQFNDAAAASGKRHAGSPFKKDFDQNIRTGKAVGIGDIGSALNVPGVSRFSSVLGTIGPAGAAAAVGVGLLVAEAALLKSILSTAASEIAEAMGRIDAMGDEAKKLGISTEALGGFRHAAGLAGVETQAFDSSLEKMQKNLGEAIVKGGKTEEALTRLGLSAKTLIGMRPEDSFMKIAAAIGGMENESLRAKAATDIFGKSGQDLLPLFTEGAGGIRAAMEEAKLLGVSLSEVDVAKVGMANDDIDKLKQALEGVANAAAVELAPAIHVAADAILRFIKDSGGIDLMVKDYFAGLREEIEMLVKWTPGLNLLVGTLGMLGGNDLMKEFEAARKAAEQAAQLDAERIKQQQDVKKAIDDQVESIAEQEKAVKDLGEEMDKLRAKGMEGLIGENEAKLLELEELATKAGKTGTEVADILDEARKSLEAADAAKEKEKADKKEEQEAKKRDDLFKNLQRDIEEVGMTEQQKKLREFKEAGATPQDMVKANFQFAEAERLKKEKKEADDLQKLVEQSKDKAKLPIEKLLEDAQRINDAVKAGTLGKADAAAATAGIQAQLDKDLESQKPKQQRVPTDNRALQKGSAEAFSAVNRAAQGIRDPNAKVEANTKRTADATAAVKNAIDDLAKAVKQPQFQVVNNI